MVKFFSVRTILVATVAIIAVSCKKESSVADDFTASISQAAVADMGAIAVSSAGNGSKDSLYVIGACDRNMRRDSIAFSSLPAVAASYLTAAAFITPGKFTASATVPSHHSLRQISVADKAAYNLELIILGFGLVWAELKLADM